MSSQITRDDAKSACDDAKSACDDAKRARDDALRAALREAGLLSDGDSGSDSRSASASDAKNRERRRYLGKVWRQEAVEFVRAIAATAALIEQARDLGGELVLRTDVQFTVLSALERIRGYPSISELARTLRVSKQAARQNVIAAMRAGSVELLRDTYDRRSIQIALTATARRELAAARSRELAWVVRLLNGLDAREMRLVAHVLRIIRRRIQRDQPLDRAGAGRRVRP